MIATAQWSATGQVHQALLEKLLAHAYFNKVGPRSTGKEEFNLAWLDSHLVGLDKIAAVDVQATLVELTSTTYHKRD